MADYLVETVMYIVLKNIENPGDMHTWENIRLEQIQKADRVVIQYQDRFGIERVEVVKDRNGKLGPL